MTLTRERKVGGVVDVLMHNSQRQVAKLRPLPHPHEVLGVMITKAKSLPPPVVLRAVWSARFGEVRRDRRVN